MVWGSAKGVFAPEIREIGSWGDDSGEKNSLAKARRGRATPRLTSRVKEVRKGKGKHQITTTEE